MTINENGNNDNHMIIDLSPACTIVSSFTPSRHGDEEHCTLRICVEISQKCTHSNKLHNTIMNTYKNTSCHHNISEHESCQSVLQVQLAIITCDNKIVFLKNIENSKYKCTFIGTVHNPCDVNSGGAPDLFLCASRILHTELGIPFSADNIQQIVRFTGFDIGDSVIKPTTEEDLTKYPYRALGFVDLRKEKVAYIRNEHKLSSTYFRNIPNMVIECVDFTLSNVKDWLKNHKNEIFPSSMSCALLCLRSEFQNEHEG